MQVMATQESAGALVDNDEVTRIVRATGDGPDDPDRPVLEISGGEGNFDDSARPEVHLLMRSTCQCCENFAQGWFRVDELRAAIDSVLAERPEPGR
jgi:hypothetical protein